MALVVLGVLLIGYAVAQLVRIQRERSASDTALAAATANAIHRRGRESVGVGEISVRQVMAANVTIQRMNVPWRDLLDAIEQATPPEIAIVELNPNPSQGELVGEAEARDLQTMSAYIDRLQKSPIFDSVVLARHEVNAQDVNHPVRFQFQAHWTKTMRGSSCIGQC